jgi:hypothetical protein
MKNIYGHKSILPFQGDKMLDCFKPQGVAVGPEYKGLSARKEGK